MSPKPPANRPAERIYSSYSGEPFSQSGLLELLVPSYRSRAARMRQRGMTDFTEIDAWLRRELTESGVPPELLEHEFGRVKAEIFRLESN